MEQSKTVSEWQQRLLAEITNQHPLDEAIITSFLKTPRHQFIPKFYHYPKNEWVTVDDSNLLEHLPVLYENNAQLLYNDEKNGMVSTISQPSLVLDMLSQLHLEKGHKVFEIGAGSGWNAALMSHLVGEDGAVYTTEIISEMVASARQNCASLALQNVHILEQDGGDGLATAAPFDSMIFTAGTSDLPAALLQQLKEGGLMLVVIQIPAGGDTLFLLRKEGDKLASLKAGACRFVPMKGKYEYQDHEPITLNNWPAWKHVNKVIHRRKFYWSGRGKDGFMRRTQDIRSFLSIVEPDFNIFVLDEQETPPTYGFGILSADSHSLVVATSDAITAYGKEDMTGRLMDWLQLWLRLGMPAPTNLNLQIYPKKAAPVPGENQWLVEKAQSTFLWSLSDDWSA